MFLNSNFEISSFNGGCDALHAPTMFLNSNYETPYSNAGVHGICRRPAPACQQLSRQTMPMSLEAWTFVGSMPMLYCSCPLNGTSNCVVQTDSRPGCR